MDLREAVAFGHAEHLVSNEPYVTDYQAKQWDAAFFPYDPTEFPAGYFRRMRFEFPNGICISVIRTPLSFGAYRGLWELAIVDGTEVLNSRSSLTPKEVHQLLTTYSQLQCAVMFRDYP